MPTRTSLIDDQPTFVRFSLTNSPSSDSVLSTRRSSSAISSDESRPDGPARRHRGESGVRRSNRRPRRAARRCGSERCDTEKRNREDVRTRSIARKHHRVAARPRARRRTPPARRRRRSACPIRTTGPVGRGHLQLQSGPQPRMSDRPRAWGPERALRGEGGGVDGALWNGWASCPGECIRLAATHPRADKRNLKAGALAGRICPMERRGSGSVCRPAF